MESNGIDGTRRPFTHSSNVLKMAKNETG